MALFKNSANANVALKQNLEHQFAMKHAMALYRKNSVFSFIPKNGCTTMRLSVAIENGCISGFDEGNWIHDNNATFIPSLGEATKADYKFVILRCPFRRLASVFLDKIVSKESLAWAYRKKMKYQFTLDDINFEQFVKTLRGAPILKSDIHWRPQSDFLLYSDYTDYFTLEHFDDAVLKLKEKIGFEVVDGRSLTNHGTDVYELVREGNFSKTTAFDIASMKRKGKCPAHATLYTPELVEMVRTMYEKDFLLYSERCNAQDMLFPK